MKKLYMAQMVDPVFFVAAPPATESDYQFHLDCTARMIFRLVGEANWSLKIVEITSKDQIPQNCVTCAHNRIWSKDKQENDTPLQFLQRQEQLREEEQELAELRKQYGALEKDPNFARYQELKAKLT